ncbi:hypothetical protein ACFY8W_30450 [Streptomyces sp. NPDC012637]|uniref:hypothetical protein n=1 Tax=Streptomyces sp. NPDC012637 TaxID=3364842 RepID=UPI0036E77213
MTKKTRRLRRLGAGILASALVLTACSGGEPDTETDAGLKVCEELLGAEGVSRTRALIGDDGFAVEDLSLEAIRESMLRQARTYKPESEDLFRSSYEPCELRANSGGGGIKRVDAGVKWSVLSMETVLKGLERGDWTESAQDLYVQKVPRLKGLAAILPCKISGTAPGQERAMPLEVAVSTSDETGTEGDALAKTLLSSLARNTQKILGCANPVSVPDVLP